MLRQKLWIHKSPRSMARWYRLEISLTLLLHANPFPVVASHVRYQLRRYLLVNGWRRGSTRRRRGIVQRRACSRPKEDARRGECPPFDRVRVKRDGAIVCRALEIDGLQRASRHRSSDHRCHRATKRREILPDRSDFGNYAPACGWYLYQVRDTRSQCQRTYASIRDNPGPPLNADFPIPKMLGNASFHFAF